MGDEVGWVVGADGKPKVGSSKHLTGKIGCPLKCTNSHSSLVRPIQSPQQFDTKCSLIKAPQWHRALHSGLS